MPTTPYQIKAYRTGYQTKPTILKRIEISNFSWLLNASAHITFWTLHVRAHFVFHLFNVSLSFRAQSAKKLCLWFAIFNFSEKLQNIFEIGLKKYGVIVQKSLSLKKYCERKNLQTYFFVYVLIYPLSKFGGNQANSLWGLPF